MSCVRPLASRRLSTTHALRASALAEVAILAALQHVGRAEIAAAIVAGLSGALLESERELAIGLACPLAASHHRLRPVARSAGQVLALMRQ